MHIFTDCGRRSNTEYPKPSKFESESLKQGAGSKHLELITSEDNRAAPIRIILHVDFDYFFAQCEEIRDPALKAKPVVVCVFSGRTEESGVVSTANYVARKYGVRSGIPIKNAKSRLATVPDAVFLPVDSDYYAQVSEDAMSILASYSDRVERAGIDECYLDVSNSYFTFNAASVLAVAIKDELRKQKHLTCSIGVAPNKMLSKIASDFHKPDGLTVVEPASVRSFISEMSPLKIPGIGPKTGERLAQMQVKTVSDLERLDLSKLILEFGKKNGTFIYNAARGLDNEPVEYSEEKKQISRIITLKKDAEKAEEVQQELHELCQSVVEAAGEKQISFRTVTVLLITNNLEQRTKSKTLRTYSNDIGLLYSVSKSVLEAAVRGHDIKIRRLGLRISDFQKSSGQNTMSDFLDTTN